MQASDLEIPYAVKVHSVYTSLNPHYMVHRAGCWVTQRYKMDLVLTLRELISNPTHLMRLSNQPIEMPIRHCKTCKGASGFTSFIPQVPPVPHSVVIEYYTDLADYGVDPFP